MAALKVGYLVDIWVDSKAEMKVAKLALLMAELKDGMKVEHLVVNLDVKTVVY